MISCKEKITCSNILNVIQLLKMSKSTHVIRLCKKTYFKDQFNLFKNDCRKTRSTTNEVLKYKNKKYIVNDTFVTSDGNCCTDKNVRVDQLN